MNSDKINELAENVLRLSRNTLLVNLRFMDMALSKLQLVPLEDITYATDGRYLAYDPMHVLTSYKNEREISVRDYLHIILHCVFRHMYVNTGNDHAVWDLACDIAVEYIISELGLSAATASRDACQTEVFEQLKQNIKQLTAEKIYRFYVNGKTPEAKLASLRKLFYADDHRIWYMTDEQKADLGIKSNSKNDSNPENNTDSENNSKYENNSDSAGNSNSEKDNGWADISQRVQVDLETFGKERGDTPNSLLQNLREVNREKYDFTEFLKKFAVKSEVMKINDDEFDYVFYTYGLKLYEKMPLIEPLEYKEVKRIREFVIAIDTSGSVEGDLVQTFVQKTYNILKSTESFFSKINLHIIQCDAKIQEDIKITSQEEFDEYIKTMKLRGFGGTDFRPVFSYVDKLRKEKEFFNLKGLIYFTDGYGVFPAKKPEYETAFVFIDDENNNPDVPPWAIKLILRKDEI